MKISVIIPTYRRPKALVRCVEACLLQEPPPYELLICVRRDDRETLAVIERLPQGPCKMQVVDVVEAGHIPPIEKATPLATGFAIAVIDDDAAPRAGWLSAIEAGLSVDGVVGVGGPVVNHPARSPKRRRVRYGRVSWYGGLTRNAEVGETSRLRRVDFLSGGNCAYRRDALMAAGFELELNRGAAVNYEADVGLSVRRLGVLLFDPSMVVDHYPDARAGAPERSDDAAYRYDYTWNLFYVAAKHYGWVRRLVFRFVMGLVGQSASPGLLRARSVSRDGIEAVRKARREGWHQGRRKARARGHGG